SSELIGRIVSLVFRIVVLLLGIFIISSTISSELYLIFKLFLLTIGTSITLLSSLGVIASIWSIWGLRPEEGVRPSEGFTEGASLIVTITSYLLAIGWVFNSGFIVGSICLLMSASAFKRLIEGASQLTRSKDINEDRVKRVVMGRDGWILVASVVMIVAFFTIPFEIVNSFIFSNYPSQQPYRAGLRAAFWGSVYVVGYTMLFAIPVSIGGAIWLEEYAPKNYWQSAIQTLVTNLAGVPAVVFGLFGLALCSSSSGFGLGLGGTILTAGITMATMAMPTIVIASQEALRAVPPSLRQGAFGVGCTKWQVIKDHVLPHAMPGMMTGTILAMSRIMGEAAPLILVGAVTSVFQEPDPFYFVDYTVLPTLDGFISWIPGLEVALTELPMWADRPIMTADPTSFTHWGSNPSGKYTVLPVQVYTWTDQPEEGFKVAAAGASLVLLGTLVMVNSVAILVRAHYRKFSNA
ncbi:MAG TPA: phosphate ABC transporter permease PstA, partial [Candidatus Thalassarchaeaceae archaeon]|nr:phosphate ABC transporter permease PstA [Candidatus Thalassarchaeaceae archaeon]